MNKKLFQEPIQQTIFRETDLVSIPSYPSFVQGDYEIALSVKSFPSQQSDGPCFEGLSDSNSWQDPRNSLFLGLDAESSLRKKQKLTSDRSQDVRIAYSTNKKGESEILGLDSASYLLEGDAVQKESFFNWNNTIQENFDLSCVNYKPVFIADKNGFIVMKLAVQNIPTSIDKTENKEVKNHLKTLGDPFLDYLITKEVIQKNQIRKDCLSSKKIWNLLFNAEAREMLKSKYKKRDTRMFLKEVDDLSDQDWILHFLRFFYNFEVEEAYRACQNIESEAKIQAYKLLASNLREAVIIFCDRLKFAGIHETEILGFEIKKIYKSEVSFRFKVNSALEVKSLLNRLNLIVVDTTAASPTIKTTKQERMEEEDRFDPFQAALNEYLTQPLNTQELAELQGNEDIDNSHNDFWVENVVRYNPDNQHQFLYDFF